jgi:methylmalonyl-CoA/ethylmalonyl-CoA epimerase
MEIFQVAQRVNDLARATAFYERMLKAPPTGTFRSPDMVFFQAGTIRLRLERGGPSALIYFKVHDVRATVDSLRADGVDIVTQPHVIFKHSNESLGPAGTDEWLAFIRDSEGNLLGLISHSESEQS